MKRNIKNILFDFDGTLVDSLPGIEMSVKEAISSVMPGRKIGSLRAFIGPPVEAVFSQVLGKINEESMAKLIAKFRESYDILGLKKTSAYCGVKKTLELLKEKGIRCFIVTNKPTYPTTCILENLALDDLFEDVVSRDSFNPPLTSKLEVSTSLMNKHRLASENTLFVGDSIDDAKSAKKLGLQFIAVDYGYGMVNKSNSELCSIERFSQILSFL